MCDGHKSWMLWESVEMMRLGEGEGGEGEGGEGECGGDSVEMTRMRMGWRGRVGEGVTV